MNNQEEIASEAMQQREELNCSQTETVKYTLSEIEARIRAITYSIQDAVLMMTPAGLISYWNPAAERIFGYTEDEVMGKDLHQLLAPPHYLETQRKAYAKFQQTGTGDAVDKTLELEACHKDGHEISIELSLSAVQLRDGWHAAGIIRDITERKRSEKELQSSQARYRALIDQSYEALALVDIQTQEAVEVNRRFTELLGYSLPEDAPLHVRDFVIDSKENLDKRYGVTLRQQHILPTESILFRHKNGAEIPVERAGTVIRIDGRDYLLSSNRDMTEERRRRSELAESLEELRSKQELLEKTNALLEESQQALLHQATHDSLTGLLNRSTALEVLAKELARSKRNGEGLAVGMCDIDHFKQINDTWGHQTGNEVLCEFARILTANIREYDVCARIGGEEFLLILPLKDGTDAEPIFERFCRNLVLSKMKTQDGVEFSISASIGVAYAKEDSIVDKLLSEADAALYQAKAQGRNCVVCAV